MDCDRVTGGAPRIGLRRAATAAALLGALALAGCGAGWGSSPNGGEAGDSPASSGWGQFLRGTSLPPTQVDPALLQSVTACPAVAVQFGQQTYQMGTKGLATAPEDVRYQASLTNTARECTSVGDNLQIKVGTAGRVITGPKGASGTVTFPVRVQVADGAGKMLYSKTARVSVTIDSAVGGAAWAYVDDQVVVPARNDLQIFVGFDVPAKKIAAGQTPPPTDQPL